MWYNLYYGHRLLSLRLSNSIPFFKCISEFNASAAVDSNAIDIWISLSKSLLENLCICIVRSRTFVPLVQLKCLLSEINRWIDSVGCLLSAVTCEMPNRQKKKHKTTKWNYLSLVLCVNALGWYSSEGKIYKKIF